METGKADAPDAEPARPITRSVALSISDKALPGLLLAVKRPADDADLPGVWGLPAASLRDGESWQAAACRAARDKLGVDIVLDRELARGQARRGETTLEMRLYAARIAAGRVRVPQDVSGVTQYVALRWALPDLLETGAARGSLCCRLQLGGTAPAEPLSPS